MNKDYKNNDDGDHEKTMTKIKKNIMKDVKQKEDNNNSEHSEIKEKIENQGNGEFDEKKISKLAKLSLLLRKSFIGPQKEPVSKFSDLKDRAVWTILMLFGFIGFISAGNFYCALLVFVIMMAIFHELIDLSKYREINQDIKYYYFLNCLICFMLYILGFLIFILSLEKKTYKYQFKSYAYNHMILVIFQMQSALIASNIFKGLVWFVLPATLVICNDITAYIFGRMFGRTPLSSLSPKKTWEGAFGAFISTMLFSLLISKVLINFDFFLCPIKEIHAIPFLRTSCDTSQLAKDVSFTFAVPFSSNYNFTLQQIQLHALVLALFSSIIAPLGGLFASGFKRAVKIKDFANTIPGHGGITDRMDCQILMGVFTYIWTSYFTISSGSQRLETVISMINSMNDEYKYKILDFLNLTIIR